MLEGMVYILRLVSALSMKEMIDSEVRQVCLSLRWKKLWLFSKSNVVDLQLLNTGKSLKGSVETVKKEANSISKMGGVEYVFLLSKVSYSIFFKLGRLTAKKVWASE